MKKLLIAFLVCFLVVGVALDLSKGLETTNAYVPEVNDTYELKVTQEVLLNNTLIGMENNPYRSITFKETNGFIEMTITYDAIYSDLFEIDEEMQMNYAGPETTVVQILETNEGFYGENNENSYVDLMNEEEGLWFVFESDNSGFIFDQIGLDYQLVPNQE